MVSRPPPRSPPLSRLAVILTVLGLLVLVGSPPAAEAQASAPSCTISGEYGAPVAVGFFHGHDWDNLGENQIGFGFATDRPTGYLYPGSWGVSVDWGDGTPAQSFSTGTTANGGAVPAGWTAPPIWLLHTYAATGRYDVHVTASGTVNTVSDGSGEDIPCADDFTSTFQINDIEVLPPLPDPGGGGDGGLPGGLPGALPTCPEAAGLIAGALYWNGLAQRYRGRSVEAGKAVIDYANKSNAAFWDVLGIAGANLAGDPITKGTAKHLAQKEVLDGYRQLWENSLNGKWPEISRQLVVLQELRKFLKALGPIGNLEGSLHLGEAMYYLGLAAKNGVLRDAWDAQADDALRRATEMQRLAQDACAKAASRPKAARAGAAAKPRRTPPYAKLADPDALKGLRIPTGAGLSRGTALRLNKLMAAQDRALALSEVITESLARARAATKARSKKWAARQLRHAQATARKLASHLAAQARLRGQTADSLGGEASESHSIEITNPGRARKLLRKVGLPTVVSAGLERLGLRPGPFLRMFTRPPAGVLVLPSLADAVGDPVDAAGDRAWAEDLRLFAAGPP
jgi:hypothetical protein